MTVWDSSTVDILYQRSLKPVSYRWFLFVLIFPLENDEEFARGTEVEAVSNQMVYYHKVGTSQAEDLKIFETPENPAWMFSPQVSDCGKFLILSISESTDPVNRLYVCTLDQALSGHPGMIKLIDNFEAEYDYITNEGSLFYFKTNLNAPNNKIVSINIETGDLKEVLAELAGVINFVICVNQDKLIISRLENVQESLEIRTLDGELLCRALEPSILTISDLKGRKQDSEFFYQVSSFVEPGRIFRFDLKTLTASEFLRTKVPGLDSSKFVVFQEFYLSKDGTKIPMFIVRHEDCKLDGNNPTLLCNSPSCSSCDSAQMDTVASTSL